MLYNVQKTNFDVARYDNMTKGIMKKEKESQTYKQYI